jgi:hypothetical protein
LKLLQSLAKAVLAGPSSHLPVGSQLSIANLDVHETKKKVNQLHKAATSLNPSVLGLAPATAEALVLLAAAVQQRGIYYNLSR